MATAENQIDRPQLRAEPAKSLKEQFASLPRGKPARVDMRKFPHAPQEVFVRAPSGAEIAAWEQSGIEYDKRGRVKNKVKPTRKAELIVKCIVDEDGRPVWSTSDTDIRTVANLEASLQNHLFKAAAKSIGNDPLGDDDDDEDDEEGN